MTTQLTKMSAEFLSLRDMVAQLAQTVEDQETSSRAGEEEREAIMEPMLDRMSELTRSIVQTRAHTFEELAQKARIVLDWINEDGDLADVLSASLCRDVVALFPRSRAILTARQNSQDAQPVTPGKGLLLRTRAKWAALLASI